MSPKSRLFPIVLVLFAGLSFAGFSMWRTQAAKSESETKLSAQQKRESKTQITNLFSQKSAIDEILSLSDEKRDDTEAGTIETTQVFLDNFNRAALTTGAPTTYTTTVTAGDGGASIASSTFLQITNDASGTANANGVTHVSGLTSSFASPYNQTLSSNPTGVEWIFNFRFNRTTNPSGFASGEYGTAIILAASSSLFHNTGNGYAVVYGNSTATDPIRLVRFTGGLTGTITNICTSGANDIAAVNNYVSVRVVYVSSTNSWSLFVRDDGASAWSDPTTGVTAQKGSTTTDTTYTATVLTNFGFYWNYATATTQTSQFDNFRVRNTAPFSVTTVTPAKNALNVSRTSNVSATFDSDVNQSTVTSNRFKVRGSGTAGYNGTISFPTNSSTQLDPTNSFKAGELITASLTSGIQSTGGANLTPSYLWQFFASTSVSSGAMLAHPTTPSFGGGDSYDIALGDIDGDGDLDALVANIVGAETVWLNNGTGSFTAHPTTPSFGAGNSRDIALGDVDGDGDLDAVVANDTGEEETVWLNNGSGSFTAHPTTPSFGAGSSLGIALGDIDGDGDLDAVVANIVGAETVWLNNGSGSFTLHPTTPSFGAGNSFGIALGDIDGDGDLDALVANASGQAETVWLNNGSGSFTAHPTTPSFGGGSSLGIALGDIDGDGDLDALVANATSEAETVWLNNGSGSFTAHPTTPSFGGGVSTDIELGDIDGDGDLDALVANDSSQAETVWLNDKTPTSTSVTSSLNPSSFGQLVTFTATVTPNPNVGPPTGTVTFFDGINEICSGVSLSLGQVQCATSTLSVGNHTITASYNGDSNFGSSTGSLNTNPQVVNPNECDYCILQHPASLSVTSGQATELIYGRIYEPGVTPPAGSSPTITAQVGFGPFGTDPRSAGGWNYFSTTFNVQYGNDDEYQGTITAPTVVSTTQFSYTYRFSFDGGANWTYADLNGAGTDPGFSFDPGNLGVMTVNPACTTDPVVTTNADSGAGSLRHAVIDACVGSTITFAGSVTSPITLTTGQITIGKNLTIQGPGASLLTVSGNNASRIFSISSGFTVNISGLTMSGGNSAGDGGGIFNAGSLTVNDSVFSGNVAAGGGGIANTGTLNVARCTFSGNNGNFYGGGIMMINGGTITVNNSTFSGNIATNGGGIGIQAVAAPRVATLTVNNSTISGNTTTNTSGGIGNYSQAGGVSSVTITASTITGNSGPNGSGIGSGNNGGVGTSVTNSVRNSIIANNMGSIQIVNYGGATTTSNGFNIVSDASLTPTATDQLNTNPLLGALGNNGGTTQTHKLLSGSPAIDKGNAFGLTVDQRGSTRPVDLSIPNASGGDGSDIGAYEEQIGYRPPVDFDGDGKSDYAVVTDASAVITTGDDETKVVSIPSQPVSLKKNHEMMRFIRLDKKPSDFAQNNKPVREGASVQARWIIRMSATNTTDSSIVLGTFDDFFVPSDYDGDGKCDPAVWNPVTHVFTVHQSTTNTDVTFTLGDDGSDPSVVGDYDGDGRSDPAVFNSDTGLWSYLGGANHTTLVTQSYGQGGGVFNLDYPVPGDFNGDGKHDFGVMRRATANPGMARFLISYNDGSVNIGSADISIIFGQFSYAIVPGDYDGDGKCDIGQVNLQGSQTMWRVLQSSDSTTVTGMFGSPVTDYTIQADYDGDGKIDLGLWTASTPGVFSWMALSGGSSTTFNLGSENDYPVAYFNTH